MLDKKIIMEKLVTLQAYYNHKLNDLQINLYLQYFQHFTPDKLDFAVNEIIKEFSPTSTTPFPLIKDFREAVGDSITHKAHNIVTKLRDAMRSIGAYKSPDFGDPALHSIIRRFGGWVVMCSWTEADWKMKERMFIDSYIAAFKGNLIGPDHLVGIEESSNILAGYDVKDSIVKCDLLKGSIAKQLKHEEVKQIG